MENKAAQRYLGQVRRRLACGRADRERLLVQCGELMDTFQQENPAAGYEEFVAAFGEPAACAAELLSTLEEQELEAARLERLWRHMTIAGIGAALALLSCVWYLKYQRSRSEKITVIIGSPQTCCGKKVP